MGIEKAVIDRTDRLIPLSCMEVEDENDDEDENDWGSGGRELRPTILRVLPVSKRSINRLQHARAFPYRVPACFLPKSSSAFVVVLGWLSK